MPAGTPGFQDSTSEFFKNFQRFIYKLLHARLRTNTICIQNRTVCKLNGVILELLRVFCSSLLSGYEVIQARRTCKRI
ncbi:Sodium/Glucose Cotransporter 1 [Manis pentadactyla]|nr:Sodium/Glucose Cotransporter 1 [Manis pentadactyla]